jgi:hypothetical protein
MRLSVMAEYASAALWVSKKRWHWQRLYSVKFTQLAEGGTYDRRHRVQPDSGWFCLLFSFFRLPNVGFHQLSGQSGHASLAHLSANGIPYSST